MATEFILPAQRPGHRVGGQPELPTILRPCLKTKQSHNSHKQELGVEVEMAKLGWGCYTVEKHLSFIYRPWVSFLYCLSAKSTELD